MIDAYKNSIHPRYRPEIDGIRALAILSVLLFHAFPEWIHGGFIGVDIFFVISGYLISTIIFRNLQNNSFSFLDFYIRRIRRIFPALVFVLLVSTLFGWFSLLPNEYAEFGKHLVGGAGFISNIILWGESGYFDRLSNAKPLLHLWSLGIEEQFYIFWPLILFVAWKRGINLLFVVLGLLTISFLLSIWDSSHNAIAAFYSPQTRFWELLIGAVLAFLSISQPRFITSLNHSDRNFLAFCGLALIGLGLAFIKKGAGFPGWWALLPTFGTSLILVAGQDAYLNKRVFSNKILVWVGCISFPLYLWHWPILSFMWVINDGLPSVLVRTIGIFLSFALATFTYKFIEHPFRFGLYSKSKALVLVSLMIVVGLAGIAIYKNSGFPERTSVQEALEKRKLLTHDVSSHNKENCSATEAYPYAKLNKDFFCMESSSGSALISSAIIGDSHAYPMYFGFYDYLVKHKNERLLLLGAPGCPPLFDVESFESGERDLCGTLMNSILHRVANDASIKTVILVNRVPLYITQVGVGETDLHNRVFRRIFAKNPESNADAYKLALKSTVRYLIERGKNIVFVFPPPELGFEPSSCISDRPFSWRIGGLSSCSISYQSYVERVIESKNTVMDALGSDGRIIFIEPAETLCDSQNCYVYKADKFMYFDNNHLSPIGAQMVIDNAKNSYEKLNDK